MSNRDQGLSIFDDAEDETRVELGRTLLLDELASHGAVEPEQRTARFRCVIVLQRPDGSELVAEGTVEGTITVRRTVNGPAPSDAAARSLRSETACVPASAFSVTMNTVV